MCTNLHLELFKLHLNDYHCHHIYFGCSHDNGYARLLEQYTEPTHTTRITLVEGVPFERELKFLQSQFSCVKFDDLFRPNKISIYNPSQHPTSQPAPSQSARTSSDTYGVPLSQAQNIYQSPYQPMIGDTSPSTAPNNAPMMNPKASSWASTATAAAQLVSPPATPTPAVSQSISSKDIPRNRYGQRVDPPVVYDKEVVNRVRNLKLCNVHFLRKDCQYDPCTHDHCYKITKNELTSLRSIARNVPCYFGNECDDPKCIYGHK